MPGINEYIVNIFFWNVNGRWSLVDKRFMVDYDIVFISETHANGSLLQNTNGYHIISDPSFTSDNHGGMAAYVSLKLFPYITNIRFSKCTLSFSFTILPGFCFMLTYMYPLDSINYELSDFGILSEEINFWLEHGFTPYIGGDYNARLGDLNILSQRLMKWRYTINVDTVTNSHGRLLAGVCELHNILPLNHCCYYEKVWDGKLTYHKAGKRSQNDFVLTNQDGRKFIIDFKILDSMWHLSDHLPLALHLQLPLQLSMDLIIVRAMELNNSFEPDMKITSRCKFKFNFAHARETLEARYPLLAEIFADSSTDAFVSTLDDNLTSILNDNKLKKEVCPDNGISDEYNKNCDTLFQEYLSKLQTHAGESVISSAYKKYQVARNILNTITFKNYEDKYKDITEHRDERKLWSEINWSGRYKDASSQQIPIQVMRDYFERLYQPLDLDETAEMKNLHSDMYIPLTDDPITSDEMRYASSKMKKGGYDYSLDVLNLLLVCLSPILLIFFNLVFYVSYPIKFGMSILATIPKKGNLKLLTNYRGIHMQNLLSLVYDRIIANRLLLWARIHPEQTAFQKGKSTLNHIFLLRIVIALAKQNNVPLFIGFFDLEKAFDKVSRSLLLKSLIKLGIGSTLFYAIKAMYSVTQCVIKSGKKLSDVFLTHSGIKQGAPSSIILFIIFMDEFIDVTRERCIRERVLELLHILLHADDTAVLSTDRSLFITKCNILITAYKLKKVSLNLKKSSFLTINPQKQEDRYNVKLENGWLSYCSTYVYLGVIISDDGMIANDVARHVEGREKSVYVKMANFMRNNQAAPITVKKKILSSCLNASLLYGCEIWSSASLRKVETLYKKAIKLTFGMKNNTPNQIVFIESGLTELKCEIYKRQYNFWMKILSDINNDPYSEVSKILTKGIDKNVHFIRHYKKLANDFMSAQECYNYYRGCFIDGIKQEIIDKTKIYTFSPLDDYILINPSLETPKAQNMLCEYERQVITRYRSGSHFLRINTGYFQRTPITARLCRCNKIQNLEHVLFRCPITAPLRQPDSPITLMDFFKDTHQAASKLRAMEALLQIRSS